MASTTVPSNSPPSQPTRRTILARFATGATVASVPSAALAAPASARAVDVPIWNINDPHPEWARQAQAIIKRLNTSGDIPDEESDIWCDRMSRFHDLIIDTPARTYAGIREQIAFVKQSIRDNCPSEREQTALANALATLERLAGEVAHG